MNLVFIDPWVGSWSPLDQFLLFEPQCDFLVGRFDRVWAMDDVAANLDAQITTDGAWCWVSWVGGAQHDTASFDGIQTFPHGGNNWAWAHVGNQTWEEWTARQISIMFLQQILCRLFLKWEKKWKKMKIIDLKNLWKSNIIHSIIDREYFFFTFP